VEEKGEMLLHIHLIFRHHLEIKLQEDQVDLGVEEELQIIFQLMEPVEQEIHHQ